MVVSHIKYMHRFCYTLFTLFAFIFSPFHHALASSIDGTIDTSHKYAWGDEIGWINFGVSGGNVHVTDDEITGYAWSANYGWINLAPPGSGVVNNAEGDLSGYAWGENIGWINFANVSIDANGYFSGNATSDNVGDISFNCSNTDSCGDSDFKVKTDWLPRTERNRRNQTKPPADGVMGTVPVDLTFCQILSPVSGNMIAAGDILMIAWNARGSDIARVAIDYSLDGMKWIPVTTVPSADGTYAWTLPGQITEASNLRLRLDCQTVTASNVRSTVTEGIIVVPEGTLIPKETEITLPIEKDPFVHPSEPVEVGPPKALSPVTGKEEPLTLVNAGDLIRGPSFNTVYLVTETLARRPFLNTSTFFTYADSFDVVQTVSDATLATLPLAAPALPKVGTMFVKSPEDPKVYALVADEKGSVQLRWVVSEDAATQLAGSTWNEFILDVPLGALLKYPVGDEIGGSDTSIKRTSLKKRSVLASKLISQ